MGIVLKMQLNILIHLARVDGVISEEEKSMLNKIANQNGISSAQLEEMIEHPKPIESLGALSSDVKFDYLYSIVQLMNIDEEIDQREIHFCQNMALRLGYHTGVIDELWSELLNDRGLKNDKEMLKSKIESYNPYH